MKKLLLSAITALAFLFGFASCSGDLHDAQIIDLTGYCIIGSVLESGWEPNGKAPLVYNEADGTYSVTVTGTGSGQNSKGDTGDAIAIIQIGDTGWGTAYRLAQPKSDGDSANVFKSDDVLKDGETQKVYQGQSGDCMIISGAEEGDKINIKVKPSTTYIEVTVSIEKGSAPALPTPYVLSGMFIRGGMTDSSWGAVLKGALLEFSIDTDRNVTYEIPFECNDISNNAFKLATSDWNDGWGGTEITVDSDFVEFKQKREGGSTVIDTSTGNKIDGKGDTDNNTINNLVANASYKMYIKTTPEKAVLVKVVSLKKVTPTVKVTGLPDEANGKVLYFTGDFNGWVEPGKDGSIQCTVANGAIEINLPEIALEGEAGKKEYNAKFASAGWTKPEITGDKGNNAQFTVTPNEHTVVVAYVEDNVIEGDDNPNENGVQYICEWSVE
ncbi:MAG: hypothetical protein K2M99_02305 [Treponemataceae bacterium]|nr:hypothetical protein [Treponemataceae bacterium]